MIVQGEMKCLLGYVNVNVPMKAHTMVFMKTKVLIVMLADVIETWHKECGWNASYS